MLNTLQTSDFEMRSRNQDLNLKFLQDDLKKNNYLENLLLKMETGVRLKMNGHPLLKMQTDIRLRLMKHPLLKMQTDIRLNLEKHPLLKMERRIELLH